jgi:YesN/AraC family two-component response regulator
MGRDLLERIATEYPSVDVIVVSGFDPPDNVDELPCTEYLVKPVLGETWREVINKLGR